MRCGIRSPSQDSPRTIAAHLASHLAYDEVMDSAGQLRVGHAEREHVVLLLRQQYAEGRLTDGELDQRMVVARAARTFLDLDRLVADLPVVPPSRQLVGPVAATHQQLGADPDHRLTITAGVSSHVRRGFWTVPAFVRLNAGIASLRVDFQQADCPHAVVDIAVMGGLGWVVLVVPDGWGVNTDRIGKGVGSVSNQVNETPRPGMPLLVLHGSSGAGSVRVRHPGWNDRRQARKAMRRNAMTADAAGTTAAPPAEKPFSGASSESGRSTGPQDAPSGSTPRP